MSELLHSCAEASALQASMTIETFLHHALTDMAIE